MRTTVGSQHDRIASGVQDMDEVIHVSDEPATRTIVQATPVAYITTQAVQ